MKRKPPGALLSEAQSVPLRDYQIEAVELVMKALEEQEPRVCLALPTGAGKTRVANNVILRWMASI